MSEVLKYSEHGVVSWPEYDQAIKERDDARELAAMYLQCMNSRAMERGETVEDVAAFCKTEFAENLWLEQEYKKLTDCEASVKAFVLEARLRP